MREDNSINLILDDSYLLVQLGVSFLFFLLLLYRCTVDSNTRSDFSKVENKAKQQLEEGWQVPYVVSPTGVRHGIFTWHVEIEKEDKKLHAAITSYWFPKNKFIQYLSSNKENTLWKNRDSYCKFINTYLVNLLRVNASLYRETVGKAMKIIFLKPGVTLYRRDTRNYETIFKQGFQLQKSWFENCNQPGDAKLRCYTDLVTTYHGVSLAKKIPPSAYAPQGYYEIYIPPKSKLLLVDIVQTAKIRGQTVPQDRVKLCEVNSLHPIPKEYIKLFKPANAWFSKQNQHYNKNYEPDLKPMGCY